MQCEQFEQILEQQDEGALPKPALTHLETCEACRALSADFAAIHDAVLELATEDIAPPDRVWISLRNQLEAEGLIRDPQEAPHTARPASQGWWAALQRPADCGAVAIGSSAGILLRSLCRQRFQGRSPHSGERLDSRTAKAGHRRDRFHPAKPPDC